MNSIGTPGAEFPIDINLVRGLLEEQHPDLNHLPIHPMDAGWDNVMFRLGDDLAVRLPRRQIGADLLEHEQTWLPHLADQLADHLADRLPIPIPTPHRIGQAGQGYPWRWSVVPWLPGVTADQQAPNANQVERFVGFLRSLHVPAPSNAPHNPFRGVPLTQRAAAVTERMQRLATTTNLITPAIQHSWAAALDAPMDIEPTWIHGDLHPRNVLVENGMITGVIDWGDITSGDRATDLASIWMLFEDQALRQHAIALYTDQINHTPISHATLQRAKRWAIFFGIVLLDSGLVDHPRHATIGENILRRLAEDHRTTQPS